MSQNERRGIRGLEPAECPPVDPRPYYRVCHVPCQGKVHVLMLCNDLFGTLLHYDPESDSRLVPHVENCPFCGPNRKPRWYGYAAVLEGATARPRLLPLSAASVRFCPEMVMYRGQLRGHVFEVFRTVAKANGPIKLEWKKRQEPKTLPACWDIKASVERLLGIQVIQPEQAIHGIVARHPDGGSPVAPCIALSTRIDPAHHV